MITPLATLCQLNSQKRPGAWQSHPLSDADEEFHLRYVAAIAFFLAIDRKTNVAEHEIFSNFCTSLNISVQEAHEQFDMRASLSGETLLEILEQLKLWNLHWFLITDIIWLQISFGEQNSIDQKSLCELCLLLEMQGDSWRELADFLMELRHAPNNYLEDYSNDTRIPFFIIDQ